ncbi:MAG: FAD-dependent oxidoreductase [Deltaproteobacteria bacterium]|jgi:NADPH-dependent 2,4-dienoyl-CoA reductase/sulfur reductase-like enzyme/rhodanese-related sulfurtransferase|nr:FAD-dependent oxidoreductase [Deltaproteobacteria bacterium]
MPKTIVIVGAVAGGATAAARIRRLDEFSDIILIEKSNYISLANCGLPYFIGGEIKNESELTLQTPESFEKRYRIEVLINHLATSLDLKKKTLLIKRLDTGQNFFQSYDYLLLAPGAEPIIPDLPGLDRSSLFKLRTLTDAAAIKLKASSPEVKSAAVVGGGAIGLELAENFVSLGLITSLYQRDEQVLPWLDFEMAQAAALRLTQKGVKVFFNSFSPTIAADLVVAAVGVKPETKLAKEAGLLLNSRGFIEVDDRMRSSDPFVYAVGDAVESFDSVSGLKGSLSLAGPAAKQARVAADNICGLNSVYRGFQGASILRLFDLTIGAVGISEQRAQNLGLNFETSHTHSLNCPAYMPGAEMMTIKIIFEKISARLLGAQIIGGKGADKRLDVLAGAIRANLSALDLTAIDLGYSPSYGSAKDPINVAGYVIENLISGKCHQINWRDLACLPKDGSVNLIDVRSPKEYQAFHIDSFINLPLDDLRQNLDKIDKDKPVFLVCYLGLRSYLASRILLQHGYKTAHLAGGLKLYQIATAKIDRSAKSHLI